MEPTDEQMRETFSLYAKEGTIGTKDLGTVARSLGQNPTEADLQDAIDELQQLQDDGTLDFEDFRTIMQKIPTRKDSEQDIKDAFRMFDKEQNGKISIDELKMVLTTMGEKLTDAEVNELLAESTRGDEGFITVKEFIELMTAK